MNAVIAMLAILIGWSLVAGRLARWNVTPALAMVLAGIVLTAGSEPFVEVDVDNVIAERVVELTLAVVLFVDATESPAGVLGREPRLTLRLLAIALPLSFLLAFLSGLALLPDDDVWVIALAAAAVIPTDLSPAVAIARDRRIPARLRGLLNVESGLNDGLVAPVFVFCLTAATSAEERESAGEALVNAVPEVLAAAGAGAALGIASARGLDWARAHGWTQPAALRPGVLGLPLMAYTLALALGGNGFVTTFVCGVAFSSAVRDFPHDALQLTEDVGTLMSLAVWFVFGQVVTRRCAPGSRSRSSSTPCSPSRSSASSRSCCRSSAPTSAGAMPSRSDGWARAAWPRSSSARSPTWSCRSRPASWSSRRWSSPSSPASCCMASAPRRSAPSTGARVRVDLASRHCASGALQAIRDARYRTGAGRERAAG